MTKMFKQILVWFGGLSLIVFSIPVVVLSVIPNAIKHPSSWGWVGIFIALDTLILGITYFISHEIADGK